MTGNRHKITPKIAREILKNCEDVFERSGRDGIMAHDLKAQGLLPKGIELEDLEAAGCVGPTTGHFLPEILEGIACQSREHG